MRVERVSVGRPVVALWLAATVMLATAGIAHAQIYVVTEADGSKRFTSEPEPGAEVYIRTHYTERRGVPLDVPYAAAIASSAMAAGLDAHLVRAIIQAESNFDAVAVSSKGALGLMQLMPATARELGVRDAFDPKQNIRGGTTHFARLLDKYRDTTLALAAYNAGEGAVDRYGTVPPYRETREYIRRVLGFYEAFRGQMD